MKTCFARRQSCMQTDQGTLVAKGLTDSKPQTLGARRQARPPEQPLACPLGGTPCSFRKRLFKKVFFSGGGEL